jgi:hypothetical protein
MSAFFKNTLCILMAGLVIYLIYLLAQPKKFKPLYMKKPLVSAAKLNANANMNPNAYINADPATTNVQKGPFIVDRLPLVEENPVIVPANEIVPMNYKDCNEEVYKDQMEKELYTKDAPLFGEKGPTKLVAFDLNNDVHRRVNFY